MPLTPIKNPDFLRNMNHTNENSTPKDSWEDRSSARQDRAGSHEDRRCPGLVGEVIKLFDCDRITKPEDRRTERRSSRSSINRSSRSLRRSRSSKRSSSFVASSLPPSLRASQRSHSSYASDTSREASRRSSAYSLGSGKC